MVVVVVVVVVSVALLLRFVGKARLPRDVRDPRLVRPGLLRLRVIGAGWRTTGESEHDKSLPSPKTKERGEGRWNEGCKCFSNRKAEFIGVVLSVTTWVEFALWIVGAPFVNIFQINNQR